MMEVHVGENAATNRSLEKDFSAPSARSLHRAIEKLGWVAVSRLVITRLVAIFDRAGVFSTSSMEFIDPNATFYPSDGRYGFPGCIPQHFAVNRRQGIQPSGLRGRTYGLRAEGLRFSLTNKSNK